jgi:hypothetical protein
MTRMLFRRRRTHEDFAAEVHAHLDLEADRLEADGLSPEAARAAAHRAFGNVTRVQERLYEASRWTWLEQLWQDVRYAGRGMRQQPSFVITAVLTLAVGIGLLTIAFTVFNAYVLRPFAIPIPTDGLYQLVWHARDDGGQGFRWRDYDDLRQRTDLFSTVIGEHTRFVPPPAPTSPTSCSPVPSPAIATSPSRSRAVCRGHRVDLRRYRASAGAQCDARRSLEDAALRCVVAGAISSSRRCSSCARGAACRAA